MESDATINRLVKWARRNDDVRALILTSTRAIPGGSVDAYSDYDVKLVVRDVQARAAERSWLGDFGEVLVTWWDPIWTDPKTGALAVGSVTNYVDGLKIDFGIYSERAFADEVAGSDPDPEFDAGYRVLLDKDHLTDRIPAPTYRSYVPSPPDEAEFRQVIANFLIGVPYVAKCLLRDEIHPAKWVLDDDMRFGSLVPMLWWRVECDHAWSLKTGKLGKGLKRYLPADTWAQLLDTFADADPGANWDAMFRMIALFERVTREVAEKLGFEHPAEQFAKVADHTRRMWEGDFAARPGAE